MTQQHAKLNIASTTPHQTLLKNEIEHPIHNASSNTTQKCHEIGDALGEMAPQLDCSQKRSTETLQTIKNFV